MFGSSCFCRADVYLFRFVCLLPIGRIIARDATVTAFTNTGQVVEPKAEVPVQGDALFVMGYDFCRPVRWRSTTDLALSFPAFEKGVPQSFPLPTIIKPLDLIRRWPCVALGRAPLLSVLGMSQPFGDRRHLSPPVSINAGPSRTLRRQIAMLVEAQHSASYRRNTEHVVGRRSRTQDAARQAF
jgi:hypothetical protein